ncbi:MAG: alpha/beta hydrolase [Burkholderiales bacterium]|nr:alpha/beta hydrolase [Burkholderiales bacterium]
MTAAAVKHSHSEFHDINGLRHHVRVWGDAAAPPLFLLHGWMDVSLSFQWVVDELQQDWRVIAPDWRGFGLSGWSAGGYWFPDYYADLEALLAIYSPDRPARVAGHSMGGVIACTYAGLRPDRIARLVSLEGFGLARTAPAEAPGRYRRWLDELATEPRFRVYDSFGTLAARLQRDNPRLGADKAQFIARAWARETAPDQVEMLSDPKHKRANPVLFRIEELIACWREITAPTLWVFGRNSEGTGYLKDTPEQLAERKGAFRDYREAWVEDAGHMMHHDQPAVVAHLIEDFLGKSD